VFNTGFNFGIPLNESDRLRFNFDFRHTKLNTFSSSSDEILSFVRNPQNPSSIQIGRNEDGTLKDYAGSIDDTFITFMASLGWTHDTLNRAVFPTKGGQQRLSAMVTIPGSDLTYYKIAYKHQYYFPIAKDFTFRLLGEFAYGGGYGDTDDLPFFEHYYGGGVRSIRGFNDNTLGPRDSQGRAFGGTTKVVGKAELFFPVPFMADLRQVRLGTFIDVGMIDDGFDFNEMRYSVGLSGEWLSPFGALSVSFAVPMNADEHDEEQMFQFSFGSGF
jgi:outer membrane protein insertion porin family